MSYWGDTVQLTAEGQTTLSIRVSADGDLAAVLCSRQQGMGSSFPISSPVPVILHKKKNCNQPSGYLIMALICISLMTNNVEHLFKSFAHF